MGLFDAIRKLGRPAAAPPNADEQEFLLTPGEMIPWHAGLKLTAVDELMLALPAALLDGDKPMGEILQGTSDLEIALPGINGNDPERLLIRLRPGQHMTLARSAQAQVYTNPGWPAKMRVRVSGIQAVQNRAKKPS